ncbi:MAG: hypothetical protein WBM26_08020 [Polyangiales bacterium]
MLCRLGREPERALVVVCSHYLPERLKRVFDIDISVCPLCGGRVRVIADVTEPDVIQTILAHLKQRAPPGAVSRQTPFEGAQNDLFAAS